MFLLIAFLLILLTFGYVKGFLLFLSPLTSFPNPNINSRLNSIALFDNDKLWFKTIINDID